MKTHADELLSAAFAGVDEISRDAFLAFRDVMHYQRQFMRKHFGEKGVHPGQAVALGMLAGNEGISQRDLADKLNVSAPTVTLMLQKLEKAELIDRRADEDDLRVTRIFLTPKGRGSLANLRAAFAEIVQYGVGSMPEKDRKQLAKLLRQLAQNMSTAVPPQADSVKEEDARD